jgi:hypothetical protein
MFKTREKTKLLFLYAIKLTKFYQQEDFRISFWINISLVFLAKGMK